FNFEDFHILYNSIQLLKELHQSAPNPLQEAILKCPMGISRLMDLLDNREEIIRNEALYLLQCLTEVNSEIQKIIAFENAFEKVLDIIIQENGICGEIIVEDCLKLLENLLKRNISNQ